MTTISLLTDGINSLWIWTYSLVAGWGIMFTLVVASVVFLFARQLKLNRRLNYLESRIIQAERDYNITLSKWDKK